MSVTVIAPKVLSIYRKKKELLIKKRILRKKWKSEKKMAENEEIAQQLAAAQLNEGGTNNDVEMESCSGTSGYNF